MYILGGDIGSFICGNSPFEGCSSLESISVSPKNIGLVSKDGVLYTKDGTTLIQYPNGKRDKMYKVKDKTLEIFQSAFEYSLYIEEIIFPSGLKEIGGWSTANCINLRKMVIPSSVIKIGDEISWGNKSMEYIDNKSNTPCSVAYRFKGNGTVWADKDGNVVSQFSNSIAYQHRVVTKISVQNEVTLNHGESLKVPCTLESELYGEKASADYCDLVITSSDPKIVFVAADGTMTANSTASGTATITLANRYSLPQHPNVSASFTVKVGTSVCNHMWDSGVIKREPTYTEEGEKVYTCLLCNEVSTEKIEKKPIPARGTQLKKGKHLYKITKTPDSNVKNGTVEFIKTTSTGKTITIPKTLTVDGITYKVTSIGKNALKGNKKVTKVEIGSNVTSIGKNAFYGCTKLQKIKLPSKLTQISDAMFRDCKSLTTITIPSKVTKIGKNAFYGCKRLRTITVKSTKIKSVGKKAFKNIYAKAQIKVPSKKYNAYKKLFKNKGQNSNVKIIKAKN